MKHSFRFLPSDLAMAVNVRQCALRQEKLYRAVLRQERDSRALFVVSEQLANYRSPNNQHIYVVLLLDKKTDATPDRPDMNGHSPFPFHRAGVPKFEGLTNPFDLSLQLCRKVGISVNPGGKEQIKKVHGGKRVRRNWRKKETENGIEEGTDGTKLSTSRLVEHFSERKRSDKEPMEILSWGM